jgi:chromosomal replication initiation ATPase DnaA
MTITVADIRGYVDARCHELQVGPEAVRGPRRFQTLVKARQLIATELSRAPWELGPSDIGRVLGNRNHATVIWLLRGGRHGRLADEAAKKEAA